MAAQARQFLLRLPPDLFARLEALAARKRRSVNNLLLVLIEQALRDEEETAPLRPSPVVPAPPRGF